MDQFIQQNLWAIVVLVLWQTPWKEWALWKSARLGDKWWFTALLLIQTLAVLDILYIYIFSKRQTLMRKNPTLS